MKKVKMIHSSSKKSGGKSHVIKLTKGDRKHKSKPVKVTMAGLGLPWPLQMIETIKKIK